jgi:hypothetical protein
MFQNLKRSNSLKNQDDAGNSFSLKKQVLKETVQHMKLVVEPNEEKAGNYIAKIYYVDDVKNVAKLMID